MLKVKREADNLIRWPGPYSKSANLPIDVANYAGAVVTLKVYAENYEMRVADAWVRTREDVAAGATSITCPNFTRPFLQTGDHIYWVSPSGFENRRTSTTYSAGTSITTAATNFDTLSWSDGASGEAIPKGTKIHLLQKAPSNDKFPVIFKDRIIPLTESQGLTFEIETEVPGSVLDSTPSSIFAAQEIIATEDGEVAENQDVFAIVDVGSGVAATVDIGRKIRARIGPGIAMAEYPVGVHTAGDDDWGWEATLPDILGSSAELVAGDIVRLHVTLSGVAGLQDVQSVLATVVER